LKQIREISSQRSQIDQLKSELLKIKEENDLLRINSELLTESTTEINSLRNQVNQLNEKIAVLNKECRICYKKSDECNILKFDCGCIGNLGYSCQDCFFRMKRERMNCDVCHRPWKQYFEITNNSNLHNVNAYSTSPQDINNVFPRSNLEGFFTNLRNRHVRHQNRVPTQTGTDVTF